MTTPTFPLAKEARDAGWYSRRHETSTSHDQAQFKRRGHYRPITDRPDICGRRGRQIRALQRHKETLAEYQAAVASGTGDRNLFEYKIRVTKRTIAAAQAKLGIEEKYAVQA